MLSGAAVRQFEADIEAALGMFRMVGAAVALIDRSGLRFGRGFGVRDQASGAPVTPDTHFFVASTTKSMSSLLVATFIDDGTLSWDQPVREVWPDFRAPTDELTNTLRVRDLLGMDSGIGEPPPVDVDAIAPYLGYYEKGWRLAFDADGTLRLRQSFRAIPLLAIPDGDYVMTSGELPGTAVRFFQDADGMRWMEIQDIETVRWTSGLA